MLNNLNKTVFKGQSYLSVLKYKMINTENGHQIELYDDIFIFRMIY